MGRPLDNKVKELVAQGNIVYSFSKLSSFNQCQFGYFQAYIKHNRGIDNCYSILGSKLHEVLEKIYNNEETEEKIVKVLNNTLIELDFLDIKFPNEKIKNAWEGDIQHFSQNYKKAEGAFICEEGFLIEIIPGVWVQGYIDKIQLHEIKHISIFDFKTSSKFDKKKLLEAGRQLVLYAYAKEQQGYKINGIAWEMLKYLYVCWTLKNGNLKKKMTNRGKWVKEISSNLEKDLSVLGIDDFEIDMMVDEAIQNNNLDNLSKTIQDKYILEDCIVEYPYTKESVDELLQYIIKTHDEIISKNTEDELDWQPLDIEKNNFFCGTLCGVRKECPHYKKYLTGKEFDKKEVKDELDDLFN